MPPQPPRADESFLTLDTAALSDTDLRRELDRFALTLSLEEARRVRELLGRAPTITELTLFDTMWSEHCSYKSSRPVLKRYLPTAARNVVVGPVEDAGIVEFGTVDGVAYGIIVAHESHNHPSQVMPVEGAATGIGGIVRDVYCMGGEVVGVLDPLRFGWPRGEGADHRLEIAREVVTGIWEYGNALGVPNLGGDVYFHPSFDENCLVNVVALGLVPLERITHSAVPPQAADEPYDLVLVGKPTDWSGMGGAAFASATLDAEAAMRNKGSVQVPDPFLKRVLTVATREVLDRAHAAGIAVGFKDLGAGGVSCVTSELCDAGGFGCDVDLSLVHTAGPVPARVVACSETQERYGLAVPARFTDEVLRIYNEEFGLPDLYDGACARRIGRVTRDGIYRLRWGERTVCEAPVTTITCGIGYDRPASPPDVAPPPAARAAEPPLERLAQEWIALLAHPNLASREHLFRHYDPEVRGCTVLRPGEADAGVVAPVPGSPLGIAVSVDGNPLLGLADPYRAGAAAVVEAARNVACVGGRPAAVTDCLNFGNPEQPEVFHGFREAVRGIGDACRALTLHAAGGDDPLPVVSGNVSFYNQSGSGRSVAPSPIVCCVGNVRDVSRCRSMHLKEPGDRLLLVGLPTSDLGGSLYRETGGAAGTARLPELDLEAARREIAAVVELVEAGLPSAVHDISDGGLAAAIGEMALGLETQRSPGADLVQPAVCADLTLREFLFGERGGFVVAVPPHHLDAARERLDGAGVAWAELGTVTAEPRIAVTAASGERIEVPLDELAVAWRDGLTRLLATADLPDPADRLPALLPHAPARDGEDAGPADRPAAAAPAVHAGRPRPRIAVLQLPGMNCEDESARAVAAAGGVAEIVRWTRPPADLAGFDGYLLPGGFSYQDRVRAGAIAAREPLMAVLHEAAAAGKPVLGICNGCQVLVEAGLVPDTGGDGRLQLALAPNRYPGRRGYHTRWVVLEPVPATRCAFLEGAPARLPVPIAHAEGRFTHPDPAFVECLAREGYLALRYAGCGEAGGGPWNPNGSVLAAAAVTNRGGNVLAMMPHPERAAWLWQVPEDLDDRWGRRRRSFAGDMTALSGEGPGRFLLRRLVELC